MKNDQICVGCIVRKVCSLTYRNLEKWIGNFGNLVIEVGQILQVRKGKSEMGLELLMHTNNLDLKKKHVSHLIS